jgi:glycosyltransferase involved in cell wall biosynthesis
VSAVAVHQLLSSVAPGDAVTGQAFAWQELLREWGHPSEVVAEHVHPDLERRAVRLDRAAKTLDGANLVLRYSVWSKTAEVALSARGRVGLGLVYHNITPGELLRDYHPTLADLCDRGRRALTRFQGVFDVVIADSSFNAADLADAGVASASGERATVVPLLLDLPEHVERRDEPSSPPLVLSVGRLAPNKRLEDVIKAFALFQRHRAPAASLVLVGTNVGDTYRPALEHLVAQIGVKRVSFTGPISSRARDSWYRRADAYIAMSVHEGFCAPLLEALSHGVPVVARGAGAVPETLGGAGLVLDDGDLALAAECLHELTTSRATRAALADAADRRLAELRPETIRPRIRAALAPLLEGP